MSESNGLISPRLRKLYEALKKDQLDELDRFWREIEGHGEPLFEAIEGDDANLYATFLWRAEEELDNVVIFSKLFMEGLGDRESGRMERLLDTNVWYRTIVVRRDARLTYSFMSNDSLLPPSQMENPIDYFGATRVSPFNVSLACLVKSSAYSSFPLAKPLTLTAQWGGDAGKVLLASSELLACC